jgi:hypothetical protein
MFCEVPSRECSMVHGANAMLFQCCACVLAILCCPFLPVQPGVASELGLPEGAWCLAQLVVEDFAFFGDGCVFLDMVSSASFQRQHCVAAGLGGGD